MTEYTYIKRVNTADAVTVQSLRDIQNWTPQVSSFWRTAYGNGAIGLTSSGVIVSWNGYFVFAQNNDMLVYEYCEETSRNEIRKVNINEFLSAYELESNFRN